MAVNWNQLQSPYLQGDISTRLGGIASNLAKARSLLDSGTNEQVALQLIRECQFLIEWTAPAELLPQLFAEILVPEGVLTEVTTAGEDDAAARQLPNVAWIQVVKVTAIVPEVAAWDLGKGESQVLSLASTTTDCAAVVDDRAARRCAQTLNISTISTGGLLVLAGTARHHL
ncbi:hypothetical protein ABN584_18735 [Gloeocapsa sp. BRSZ]